MQHTGLISIGNLNNAYGSTAHASVTNLPMTSAVQSSEIYEPC